MFGDDIVFALEDDGPVELRRAEVVDAHVGGVLELIPQLGVVEDGFGGDAAPVEAGAAEFRLLFNQRNLEAIFAGADGSRVAGRAAAEDGDVVDGVGVWMGRGRCCFGVCHVSRAPFRA